MEKKNWLILPIVLAGIFWLIHKAEADVKERYDMEGLDATGLPFGEPRRGYPKTDAERRATHSKIYQTTDLTS